MLKLIKLSLILLISLFFSNISNTTCTSQEQDNYQNFFMGAYKHRTGKTKAAQDNFDKFFASNKTPNKQAYSEYLNFLFETKQYSKFESVLNSHADMFKDDEKIQLYHAAILKNLGAKQKAQSIYQNLSRQFPQNQEIAYELILNLIEDKNYDAALKILQKLLQENIAANANYIFHLIACKIYISLGKLSSAKSSVESALNLYPQSGESWLMFALINQELNDLNDAIYGYSRFLDISGKNKSIESELLKLKLRRHSLSQSNLAESLLAYNSKNYKQALIYLENVLKDDPGSIEAKLLKIEILITLGDLQKALNIMEKEIESGENEKIWLELLYLIFQYTKDTKDKNLVIKNLKQILKNTGKSLLVNLYGADIFFKIDDNINGIKYAEKALRNTDNLELKSKIIYQIATIYYQDKDYKKLNNILDKNILLKTDYAPLLNLAAYYFATKGKNLELAQKLLDKALKIDPKNLHYLDTKAKILYKQKKYKESLEILEKIAKLLPEDKFVKINLEKTRSKLAN